MKPQLIVLTALMLGFAAAAPAQPAPNAAPVNRDATPEARALLNGIDTISGHATLSGQHNFPNHVSRWSDRVYDLTGKYPELFGQDFGFAGGDDKDSTLGRPSMIAEAIRQYRSGAVVALTWHAVRPTEDEPVTFLNSVQGHLTDWEWHQLLTPGTDLYNRWCRQVDGIAGYLRQLQDAGVPVLFRPYHEMNGNWFWWGGRPGPDGSAALYRQLYDRYVHVHHLSNLVWVWNVNSPGGNAGPVAEYYPGAGYADVLTMDIYGSFEQSYYESMLALAGPTRPIALAEVGAMPSLEVLSRQPRWAYFMMWSGMAEGSNTPEALDAVFHAPNIIVRGDPRWPAPAAAAPAEAAPVAGAAEAKAALARLYAARGKGVLLGQAESVSGPAAAGAGKRPELVSLDAGEGADPAQVEAAARAAAGAGQLVELRWRPASPSGGTGPLTDFEWSELMKPSSDLHMRWAQQADSVAKLLKQLERARVAVLFSPYPEANGKAAWYGGRPGVEGSQELYRQLFTRLTGADGVRNAVWLWTAGMPTRTAAGGSDATGYADPTEYAPGVLYMDAVTVDVASLSSGRSFADGVAARLSGGKPFGVLVASGVPEPAAAARWSWVTLSAATAADSGAQPALTALYADPHSLALPAAGSPGR